MRKEREKKASVEGEIRRRRGLGVKLPGGDGVGAGGVGEAGVDMAANRVLGASPELRTASAAYEPAVYLIMARRVTASRPAGFAPLATFFLKRRR